LILEHYNRNDVLEEIIKFSKDRWLAFSIDNKIFKRYQNKIPLRANNIDELKNLIIRFKPRSIFASINLYKKLENINDLELNNIYSCTPTIDIDNDIKNWKATIKIVEEIVYLLDKFNIKKSIIIKWSGNGCHLHLNHKAISESITKKYHPLDLAYAVVEFIIRKIEPKVFENKKELKELKIENKIDAKRVFTAPLSLHRELDVVCICISLNDLKNFDISWTAINNFKHFKDWDRFDVGELDELLEIAYREIGPRSLKRYKRKYPPVDEQIRQFLDKYGDLKV
jgi:hypothetical protein